MPKQPTTTTTTSTKEPKVTTTTTTTTTKPKPNASEQAVHQQHAAAAAISIIKNEADAKASLLALFVLLVKAGTLKVKPSQTKAGRFVLSGAPKAAPAAAALVEQYLKANPDQYLTQAWDSSTLVESLKGSNLTRILASVLAYLPNAESLTHAELMPACQQAIVSMGGVSPITAGAKLLKAQQQTSESSTSSSMPAKLPKADERSPEQHAQFLAAQFAMLQQYATKYKVSATKVAELRKAAGIK